MSALTSEDRARIQSATLIRNEYLESIVERIVSEKVAAAEAELEMWKQQAFDHGEAGAESAMDLERAIEVLKQIRDDSTTPMNTAADIDQVLIELLDVRDEDE